MARDASGYLGIAVQSHWFSVGTVVPFIESGLGAVAIQSFPEPTHGPRALSLLRSGVTPVNVILELLEGDSEAASRQLAIVDAVGEVAVHTGARCIPEAGHRSGEQFSAQANLMDRGTVWDAMGDAFERANGDLADRLMRALEAAEAEGGDIRGRQSAALVVVKPEASGFASQDRVFDLRVEDHSDPVAELRRLIGFRRVYIKLTEGDDLVSKGDVEGALTAYAAATEMVSDTATGGEAAFWTGITLAAAGHRAEAVPFLRRAQAQRDAWARLVPRLSGLGILPDDLIESLVVEMRGLSG